MSWFALQSDVCLHSQQVLLPVAVELIAVRWQLVPVFEFPDMQFNSYILDFYKHGQKDALVKYNRIKDDDVWDSLNEFNLCVKALYAAMERRVLAGGAWVEFADENVLNTFRTISEVFNTKLKAIAE